MDEGEDERHLLSLLRGHRMKCLLRRMLDETEFLSDYGIRSLSKFHEAQPFEFEHGGSRFSVGYVPAEFDVAACSAAIRIGAGRSGCRSTTC